MLKNILSHGIDHWIIDLVMMALHYLSELTHVIVT